MKSRHASAAVDVDLGRRCRVAGALHGLTRPQQRLGRNARPVRALASDQLALDHGDVQPARRRAPPRSARPAPRRRRRSRRSRSRSRRQLRPGLLRHHVRGVPVGPVLIGVADALLMLAVRDRRAPHRARQVAHRRVRRLGRVDPAGQPGGDLLQQPGVAVGVAERRERAVAGVAVGPAADPVGFRRPGTGRRAPGVEHLARLGAVLLERVAGCLDIGDDQVHALGASRARRW